MDGIMTIAQISAKIDLRLNKSASGDYDNIWSYAKQEAFTKGTLNWVRRQKHGRNQLQEGDEESDVRVDDLQILLTEYQVSFRNKGIYVETEKLPEDYLYFKRLTPFVTKGPCKSLIVRSHLREEANVNELIQLPSFDFEETFHTIIGNRIHLYHNNDFQVNKVILTYYRRPTQYSFKNLTTVVEFKDDVCELLVDEACKILATDMGDFNQKSAAQERTEEDN